MNTSVSDFEQEEEHQYEGNDEVAPPQQPDSPELVSTKRVERMKHKRNSYLSFEFGH